MSRRVGWLQFLKHWYKTKDSESTGWQGQNLPNDIIKTGQINQGKIFLRDKCKFLGVGSDKPHE